MIYSGNYTLLPHHTPRPPPPFPSLFFCALCSNRAVNKQKPKKDVVTYSSLSDLVWKMTPATLASTRLFTVFTSAVTLGAPDESASHPGEADSEISHAN